MPETSEHATAASTEPTFLDQSTEGHIEKLYRAAVGVVGTDYYLPLLSRFEAYGRASPSWNWAACVCTLSWLVFRGLWLAALLYLGAVGAAVAMLGLSMMQADPPMAVSLRWSLWAGLATLALLVPGFFGNAWLYRAYRQRLENALASTNSLRDACLRLARQSSTRARMVAIVLANLALAAALAIGFWPTTMPTQILPRASGELENPVPAATAPVLSASASASDAAPMASAAASAPAPALEPEPASGVVASAPSASPSAPAEPMAPIAQAKQPAAAASPEVARPTGLDFDLQTLGPAARGALAQDAAIRDHARSARHPAPAPAIAAAPRQSASDASTTPAKTTAAAPVTRTPAPAAPARGTFLINVGLFAQQDNALRVHARLKEAGLPATSTTLETRNGPRTRVRVGPFASRAPADAAAQRIRAMQLDAVVIRQ